MTQRNFIFHLHPLEVARETLKPSATWGLGLISLTLFLILCCSGILLMVYYIPTSKQAYASMLDLQYAVSYGAFVRTLHRWAAHAMVFSVFLHLLRVIFTGAYFHRELNWAIGTTLFVLTAGLAFTGYLLPWDQRAFWAVTVSANLLDHVPGIGAALKRLLLGGPQVGQGTLIRFYMLHVALLPFSVAALVPVHLWRIRKDGGLAREPHNKISVDTIPSYPHLILREAILITAVLAILFLTASFMMAPLGEAPNIYQPANPEKTPWYFLWLQEMVSYSAPVGGLVFPAIIFLGILLLPFYVRDEQGVGQWFGGSSNRWLLALMSGVATLVFIFLQALFLQETIIKWLATQPAWSRDFLNPASGMLLVALISFFMIKFFTKSGRTAFLTAFLVLLVAVIGFSIIGWWRGPMWLFFWPWEEWPLV